MVQSTISFVLCYSLFSRQLLDIAIRSLFSLSNTAMTQVESQVHQDAVLTYDDFSSVVTNTLQTKDFRLLQTEVKPLGEDLVGYMSKHLKIEATVMHGTPAKETKLHYFGKAKPSSQGVHLDLVNNTNLFIKETCFFSILYGEMKRQYEEAHKCENNPSFCVCSCYLVRDDLIVLEDLSFKGFRLHESRNVLDYDHCAVVIQTLASFHAASVSVEEKQLKVSNAEAQKINQLHPELCREALWSDGKNDLGPAFLRSSINTMLGIAEYLPNYGRQSEYFEVIYKKLPEAVYKIYQLVLPSKQFRNVVCHGDLWKNNIMFRYENDKPVEVRFIDYQVIRYCPPTHDVIAFLYLTTTRKFRELHLMSLLEIYHKTLMEELASYGLKANEILPWNEFLDSLQDAVKVGLIMACLYYQVIQLKPGVMSDVFSDPEKMKKFYFEDKSDILVPQFKSDPIFNERYGEIFEEFIEKCILCE